MSQESDHPDPSSIRRANEELDRRFARTDSNAEDENRDPKDPANVDLGTAKPVRGYGDLATEQDTETTGKRRGRGEQL